MPGHLAVRNLTRQTLTLKYVEQFNVTVKDKAESKVESLTSNFTSLLKDAIPGGPAESSHKREKSAYHKLDNHAKARKRSNLPKNSTEIMRAWFDQVSLHLRKCSRANQTRASSCYSVRFTHPDVFYLIKDW